MPDEVAVLANRVAVLANRLDNLESRLDDHVRRQNGSMEKIELALLAMHKKIDGRPSWPVATLLVVLTNVCVGLIVSNFGSG